MFKVNRIFLSFMLLVPLTVYGEEIRFGIGWNPDVDAKLYVPMIRGDLFFEPTLQFSRDGNKNGYTYNGNSAGGESTSWIAVLGVGIFKRTKASENIHLYKGGRVSVSRGNGNSISTYSTGSDTSSFKTQGYSISPVVGAEYEFVNNFSVSLELAYIYSKSKSDSSYSSSSSTTATSSQSYVSYRQSHATLTEMIVRYRF